MRPTNLVGRFFCLVDRFYRYRLIGSMRIMLKNIVLFALCWSCAAQAATIGDVAPFCNASMVESGLPIDLAKLRGKVVLLDFWATWCPPCKKSIPFFNRLQNKYADQGLEIVAVNVDENPDDARLFLQNIPIEYSVALDPVGDCPEKYQVKAMPSSYFIDKQGTIRKIHLGFRDRDKEGMIRQLLQLMDEK